MIIHTRSIWLILNFSKLLFIYIYWNKVQNINYYKLISIHTYYLIIIQFLSYFNIKTDMIIINV